MLLWRLFRQSRAFVQGHVICFAALDLVLRNLWASVVRIAFVVHVSCVNADDCAADVTRL